MIRPVDALEDPSIPEVVTLWVDACALAGLVTLANYDRPRNDNVIVPFAAGCQSIWTLPLQEARRGTDRCVVGLVDPAVRRSLPRDVLAFSAGADRFLSLAACVRGGFLDRNY